jgi:hypothetical protein
MAVLRHIVSGLNVVVRGRSLVGRSARADVRLTGEGASSEHASIRWDGVEWILRDFASRNGTRINEALIIGQELRLAPGDQITFGDPEERWTWIDGTPPRAAATRDDGLVIEAENRLLLLPDSDKPQASIFVRDDRWEVDLGGATRPIEDGEVVDIDGRRFRLDLPSLHPSASKTRTFTEGRRVADARVIFRASWDEEHVDLSFEIGGTTKDLPARSFHYMLLLLARTRQADRTAKVPPEEAGWIYSTELAEKLGVTVEKLNVDVHRARHLVAQADVFTDPENIVERRRTTTQVRLGLSRIQITTPSRPDNS